MKDIVFGAHINRHVDHFPRAVQGGAADFLVAIEERKIRRTVEAEANAKIFKTSADADPFSGGNMFGEVTGIIEAKLNKPEAVFLREGNQPGEIAPSIGKAKTALDGKNRVQVLSSFFFAAGDRTLFRISLYPGECLCSERSVGGSPTMCW